MTDITQNPIEIASLDAIVEKTTDWESVDGIDAPEDNATEGATLGDDLKDSVGEYPTESQIVNYVRLTVGENITENDVVCMVPDYTTLYPSDDAYVHSFDDPDTNYGSAEFLMTGNLDSGDYTSFIKFNLSSLPDAHQILKAELTIQIQTIFGGDYPHGIRLNRVSSADWDEDTITYNTKPTSTDDVGSAHGAESTVDCGSGSTSLTFDLTYLVRKWKSGALNNYGVEMFMELASNDGIKIYSKEASAAYRPVLTVYLAQETDNLLYKATYTNYFYHRSVIGIAKENISSGNSGIIQVTGVSSGHSFDDIGSPLYLASNGGINSDTTNITSLLKLGRAVSSTQMLIEINNSDIEIESIQETCTGTSTSKTFIAPVDAKYCIAYISYTQESYCDTAVTIRANRTGQFSSAGFTDAYTTTNNFSAGISWSGNTVTVTMQHTAAQITKLAFYT